MQKKDELKCMKCGRCSASCPVAFEMDIPPHQFTTLDAKTLQQSDSIWKCLSCFCCAARCPRDVKPVRLIEIARQAVLRPKDGESISADTIPALVETDMPQQLLVSAFRKYRK